jgi:hypothetical protein
MQEIDLENYILKNSEVIEEGLTFVGQQQRMAGKRVDLLFESRLGEVVVVEVKRIARRKDIGQLFDYAGYFLEASQKPVRVVLVAFQIPRNYKNTFDYFGIEYTEVPETKVAESLGIPKGNGSATPVKYSETSFHEETVNDAGKSSGGTEVNLTRKAMTRRLKGGHFFRQASDIIKILDGPSAN